MERENSSVLGTGSRDFAAPVKAKDQLVWQGGAAQALVRQLNHATEYRLVSSRDVFMFCRKFAGAGETIFDGHAFRYPTDPRPIMSFLPSECEQTGWAGSGETSYTALFLDSGVLTEAALELAGRNPSIRPGWIDGDPLCWQIADAIKAECEAGGAYGTLYAETMSRALALHLVRISHERDGGSYRAPKAGGLAPYQLRRVQDYIDDRIADDLSLAELSALVDLSAHHFCRAFRQSTGLPPHRWQIRQRVKRAQGTMLSSDLSLAEVAVVCGFSDQSHFTTVFRKLVGETPRVWRRRHRS